MSFLKNPLAANVGDLKELSGVIDMRAIKASGVVKVKRGRKIKILGGGALEKPLTIRGIEVSKSARRKIEAAGGKVE